MSALWMALLVATAGLEAEDKQVELVEVEISSEPARVIGVGADGETLWELRNPYWGERWEIDATPRPTLVADQRAFVASGADLLELAPETGNIVARVRFPATIERIRSVEGNGAALHITVSGLLPQQGERELEYRLGEPTPGRAGWGWPAASQRAEACAWLAVENPFLPLDELLEGRSRKQLRTDLRALTSWAERDPGNGFTHLLRAEILRRLGEKTDAAAALALVADSRGPWDDLIALSSALDRAGRRGLARLVFARGLEEMHAQGVRPERQQSLIAYFSLVRELGRPLDEAFAAGDTERVHELASRTWSLSSRAELAPQAWHALATWMKRNGRSDLATVWRERARFAEGGMLNRVVGHGADRLPWRIHVVLVAGLLFAAPLVFFAIGLTAMRRRHQRRETRGAAGGPRFWPRFLLRDLLSVALLVTTCGYFAHSLGTRTEAIGALVGTDLMFDSLSSPKTSRQLAELPQTAAVSELRAYAEAEAAAALAGDRYQGPMPDESVFVRVVSDMAKQRSVFETVEALDGIATMTSEVGLEQVSPTARATLPVLRLPESLLMQLTWLLVPLVLGVVLAGFLPRVALVLGALIPGNIAPLGPLRGLATGLWLACLLIVAAGAIPLAQDEVIARYYGMAAIWPEPETAVPAWAWTSIIGISVLHVGLLVGSRWHERRACR